MWRDFGLGAADTETSIRLFMRGLVWLVVTGVGVAAIAMYLLLFLSPARHDFGRYARYQVARGLADSPLAHTTVRWPDSSEDSLEVPAKVLVEDPSVHAWALQVGAEIRTAARPSWVIGGTAALLVAIRLTWKGHVRRRAQFRRGATLSTAFLLRCQLRLTRRASPFSLGGVPLIRNTESQHILILGRTGAGKTQAFRELMRRARMQGDPAIVWDSDGGLLARWYRAGDPLCNMFDARHVPWPLYGEIGNPDVDPGNIAATLFATPRPDFWFEAATMWFADGFRTLAGHPHPTHAALYHLFATTALERIREELANTAAAAQMAVDRTAEGIRTTLLTRVAWLKHCPDPRPDSHVFTIKDWVAQRHQFRTWLWFVSREDLYEVSKPLISLWVDQTARQLLSTPETHERTWLFLDEFASLHYLPAVLRLLERGRKRGVVIVLGLQSLSQLDSGYGHDMAKTIRQNCATQLCLALNDAETAEEMSQLFGVAELSEPQHGLNAGSAFRPSINTSHQIITRRILLPVELLQLPDLIGYLRLPGGYPIVKVTFPYRHCPQVTRAYEPRAQKISPSGLSGLVDELVQPNDQTP